MMDSQGPQRGVKRKADSEPGTSNVFLAIEVIKEEPVDEAESVEMKPPIKEEQGTAFADTSSEQVLHIDASNNSATAIDAENGGNSGICHQELIQNKSDKPTKYTTAQERMAAAKKAPTKISWTKETKTQILHCHTVGRMPNFDGMTKEEEQTAFEQWVNIRYEDKYTTTSCQTDISSLATNELDQSLVEMKPTGKREMLEKSTQTEK